jgi:Skp family chaperone for outer membrane proteins
MSLLVTSSAFRLILSDILVTSRDILADVAVDVAKVAAAVELRAGQVEEIIRPADSELQGESRSLDNLAQEGQKVQEIAAETTRATVEETKANRNDIWQRLEDESPDRIKETVLKRIGQVSSLLIKYQHIYNDLLDHRTSSVEPSVSRGFDNPRYTLPQICTAVGVHRRNTGRCCSGIKLSASCIC